MLGAEHRSRNPEFPFVLSRVIEFIKVKNLPACLVPPYQEFFKKFTPSEDHNVISLKVLLALARSIDADMTWVAKTKSLAILSQSTWSNSDD